MLFEPALSSSSVFMIMHRDLLWDYSNCLISRKTQSMSHSRKRVSRGLCRYFSLDSLVPSCCRTVHEHTHTYRRRLEYNERCCYS